MLKSASQPTKVYPAFAGAAGAAAEAPWLTSCVSRTVSPFLNVTVCFPLTVTSNLTSCDVPLSTSKDTVTVVVPTAFGVTSTHIYAVSFRSTRSYPLLPSFGS